jgi:5-oxoprolinase (ATP-hydrolysing)
MRALLHNASDRSSPSGQRAWQVWIDTGGTFTDCLAVAPNGVLHRAKVLSTSALRGRVLRRIDDRRFNIEQQWDACDDLIAGFRFRAISGGGALAEIIAEANGASRETVRRFNARQSIIELHDAALPAIVEGVAIEVISDEPAPILAARLVTRTPAGRSLPPIEMRLATTRGTNALLERTGAPTVLFITQGFGDLLTIGDQQRPELFALNIIKALPVHVCAVEVPERMSASGSILVPLDVDDVERRAAGVLKQGIRAAAVALVHSHVNPMHERRVAETLRRVGFEHVTCSSDIAPMIKILPRAQTAVVGAHLSTVIGSYLDGVQKAGTGLISVHVMTSAGGLVRAERFRACESLLSGPAGGVAGAAEAAKRSGFTRIIGFDMGGTSTDVARYDGDFDYRFEHAVGGVRLMAPALNIHSVAAGGGSICDFIDGRISVGPHSAGADPGPACYGMGGSLTLTDVNLLLGRLGADQFEIPISRAASDAAMRDLLRRIASHSHSAPDADSLLEGLLEIANQLMSAAIERISIRQGYDPADHALVAFGGAGGQHACAVADRLGIKTIILPKDASLLSALGLGHAVIERFAQRQVLRTLDACEAQLPAWLDELSTQATASVVEEGIESSRIIVRRQIVHLRLAGQDYAIPIDVSRNHAADQGLGKALRSEFDERYQSLYGHSPPTSTSIEVESLRVIASAKSRVAEFTPNEVKATKALATRHMRARFGGQWIDAPVFMRPNLACGAEIDGPALVFDRHTALVVEEGWRGRIDAANALIVTQDARALTKSAAHVRSAHRHELIAQEIFAHRLTSIAVDMGQMLQRTALSVNVKERLDFSCAVMDAEGQLVVNAPHIPVHLGAMGMCVRSVRQAIDMRPGDVIVTNHPRYGGTHLPDITVITPVFDEDNVLLGYVASRAHHAEIGGTKPGSMPPNAKTLAEEGVVIAPQHLIRAGASCFDDMDALLRRGPHPSRAVADNLADLQAAVAANERGRAGLVDLARPWGVDGLHERMRALTDQAHGLARAALRPLMQESREAVERLDDGSIIRVTIEHDVAGRAVFDFTGTAAQHPGNLNATPAIVHSAVMYLLRLLIGRDVPLNEGLMRAVVVQAPEGSILNPQFEDDPTRCPAVVGGNTETSQRLVDTLIKALELSACSQGTMNNVLFGNDRFGYYETICGGAGAGPGFAGADAVHTHMTNTRITDIEVIEHRYPVRVERFAIRRGSGGAGEYRGGDGAAREITFLEPMSLSVLSQHRVQCPFGVNGGQPGAPGAQRVVHPDGNTFELTSIDGCDVRPGDRLIIETPGGGGFGRIDSR